MTTFQKGRTVRKAPFIFQCITFCSNFFVYDEHTLYFLSEGQKTLKNSLYGDISA